MKTATFRFSFFLAALALLCGSALAQTSNREPIAAVSFDRSEVRWQPQVEYFRLVLTVSGPEGQVFRKAFKTNAVPSFKLTGEDGNTLPDGHYTYELTLIPRLAPEVVEALAASREKGNSAEVVRELRKSGQLPAENTVQSGSFLIEKGTVFAGGTEEPGAPTGHDGVPRRRTPGAETQDQVIPDDLIVQGSACVGLDCVNGEVFGFDTIRMKENNTRLQFDDTSTTAGFPTNNWQIRANSSASGGTSFLGFVDQGATGNSETGTIVFSVSAGAPANSLFVSSTGRVGFRTSTPVLDLHVTTSDTPALRFEQNASGGFTAQTWDVAGNEANFFVRDVTGGSRLPFRIRPGAPTSSIDISVSGDVGVGTASPTEKLHVFEQADVLSMAKVENPNNGTGSAAFALVKANTASCDIRAHADARTITRYGVTLGGWTEVAHTAGLGMAIGTHVAAPLILGTNALNRIHITAAGDVGIGTAAPAGKLDVNGTIFQRGILIHADYVFDPGYTLETIEDHADFMWNNRHLPALGARKVDEQGREVVEIGAQMRGILEELEKAHIYIEQLNGTMAEKDARMAKLEQQNAELGERLARLEALVKMAKTDQK